MNVRIVLCAVVVVSASSCKPTLDGPCASKEMAELRGALGTVEKSQRATLTTIGLGEACQARLPGDIADGIEALGTVSPADRATLIASMLAENLRFARPACADWEKVVGETAAVDVKKRAAHVFTACKYERFDLFTLAEFEESWKASGYALLAVPMYAWLVDRNMEPAEAKRLARSMALDETANED